VFWNNDDLQCIRTIANTHYPTDYTSCTLSQLPILYGLASLCIAGLNQYPLPHIHFRLHGATALVGQGFLIMEASTLRSNTPHLVGLLWRNDQPYLATHSTHKT
jgi:hypothetical protein